MNDFLEHALDYAERGWSVFPCRPENKQPLTAHGLNDATRDPDTIRTWWSRHPDAMIGVAMGPASGVFALDPDAPKRPGEPDGRQTWSDLCAANGWKVHTHEHLTPNGGRHLLFRWPEGRDVTNREGVLKGRGINVRGRGGYVVAPPSRMADGRAYQVAEPFDFFRFDDAPSGLLDMLEAKPDRTDEAGPSTSERASEQARAGHADDSENRSSRLATYLRRALDGELERVRKSGRGSRNNDLNDAAFRLGTLVGGGHLAADMVQDALFQATVDCGLVADDGQHAVMKTIASGMEAGAQKPREILDNVRQARGERFFRDAGQASDGQAPPPGNGDGSTDDHPREAAGRSVIRIVAGELPQAIDDTEDAMIAAAVPIFVRGRELVRPVADIVPASSGRVTTVSRLRTMCTDSLGDMLGRVILYEHWDGRKKDWAIINPPKTLTTALLARDGGWRLPRIAGVISTPTLRPDGTVLRTPGFDAATGLYLTESANLTLPAIADQPTREDAVRTLTLLSDLLAAFPFVSATDRSVALSGILTAVLRGAMPSAPLHAIRAHTPGSGKTFLVDIASAVATGKRCPVIAAGKTDEETEKRLGGLLRQGAQIISLDNVNGELGGDTLCQVAELPLVRVRILGRSDVPEFECRSTIFATGNGLVLVGDMTRRTVLCTLDAGVERPELHRFAFDPIGTVLADRGAYVAAVLTIARAYRVAGAPHVCDPVGSYSAWTDMVRAPLIWLGEADPVVSMEKARDEDPELSAIRELFGHWRDIFTEGAPFTAARLIETANEMAIGGAEYVWPEFRDCLLRQAGDGRIINSKRLGRWFSRISGRVVDGYKLEVSADVKRGNRHALVREGLGKPPP